MQRYFIEQTKQEVTAASPGLVIKGEDVHHIANVMRMTAGDHVICCAKDGHEAKCRIVSLSKEEVVLTVIEWTGENRELPLQVHIANGLPKGDKLEWIIQKGTELGASSFIPYEASRSVVKLDDKKAKKKRERWAKIAKEAAEQSHRNKVPEVKTVHTFQSLLESLHGFDKCVVAYEESSKQGETNQLQSVIKSLPEGSSVLMVFGPEGGFTEGEVEALKEKGAAACGLGPRILRAETAPLYALAAVSYHTELLRGE
ncbi:16S rRNA (uracil(1498)-N(3))-methyltransferase [Bacillus swezeyi]|uniref:Ribosomal RNA small subunit methyltransferase E n=1 Tax=Bacillus swezeyi TaxID=1925020 RepID=A0A1R1RUE3_9BACI|nr:16S rRNA (uracil(1498)-N(3))-methyltransferase [Bacillus swezeyi]MEC1261232.1 16S rRNA (uracil(1498)-N(3))-methyltransferase [Bacillus swezeyi]MED2929297.1 16S rRNA (uracil(1498)-N(3))-methyltransferase [Bacillus swezeyi]MED2941109.1 16S rRNA (uracil(1498)-N(3))-methyltransferase [Bacillus swezeyi]MED2963676.1 16S rRNA (uracil(1498)-N(3))-methyltransferase [Bacillus swezeyi]MED2975591.1 16S rRNA (uracil(1498)-N(3))-methyltransferase [Bacillus swezeyi]